MAEVLNEIHMADQLLAKVQNFVQTQTQHRKTNSLEAQTVQAAGPQTVKLGNLENGQEIYNFWQGLGKIASQKALECTALFDQRAKELIALEDEKNTCYQRIDTLQQDLDTFQATLSGLNEKMQLLQQDCNKMELETQELSKRIRKLEKDKNEYDILRWIPVVGLISEIVAAIDGTRMELRQKKNSLENRKNDLSKLNDERNINLAQIASLQEEIYTMNQKYVELECQIQMCQESRNQVSQDMIAWKDREQYCLSMAQEIDHLIAMEAPVEEFHKFIADNPPPFALTA